MKNHFLKLNLFCLFMCGSPFYAMNFAKKRIENPQERFLNVRFDMVCKATEKLLDDSKKAVQEEIAQNKNWDLIRLFNVGTLPPELQEKIILIFCENNKKLAEECLKLRIGALHDRKWAHDVMLGQKKVKLRDIINMDDYHRLDPIFIDEKEVFSLAKEIQHFEESHQKDFKALSVHNLRGIQTIIEKCLCLKYYANNEKVTCNVRKKITWQRFKKHSSNWVTNKAFMMDMFIVMGPLIIKSTSRLIELFYCEKIMKEDVINFNSVAQTVKDHLMLSQNPSVRDYHVPLKPVQDYSDFDYIKMYSPYLLFFGYIGGVFEIIERNFPVHTRLIYACEMLVSIILGSKIDREDILYITALLPVVYVWVCSLLSIFSITLKQTKTVKFNQISDLLNRTDIEIVS